MSLIPRSFQNSVSLTRHAVEDYLPLAVKSLASGKYREARDLTAAAGDRLRTAWSTRFNWAGKELARIQAQEARP